MRHPLFSPNLFLFLLLLILVIGFLVLLLRKDTKYRDNKQNIEKKTPMDNKHIVSRFSKLRKLWYEVASDKKFKELGNNLADINSESLFNNLGSKEILQAYTDLDKYIKSLPIDKDVRVTLIYTDGIVFYDSALPINRVYFLQNGLPRPVSMSTLGSPLKNHNVVPEMTNAVSIHNKTDTMYLLGYPLSNPIYNDLVQEGFGFFERISSSLNVPYSYMAKFLPIPSGNGNNTFFLDGFILRLGVPIMDNFFTNESN